MENYIQALTERIQTLATTILATHPAGYDMGDSVLRLLRDTLTKASESSS